MLCPLSYVALFCVLLPVSALLAWLYFGVIEPRWNRWRSRNHKRSERYRILCD